MWSWDFLCDFEFKLHHDCCLCYCRDEWCLISIVVPLLFFSLLFLFAVFSFPSVSCFILKVLYISPHWVASRGGIGPGFLSDPDPWSTEQWPSLNPMQLMSPWRETFAFVWIACLSETTVVIPHCADVSEPDTKAIKIFCPTRGISPLVPPTVITLMCFTCLSLYLLYLWVFKGTFHLKVKRHTHFLHSHRQYFSASRVFCVNLTSDCWISLLLLDCLSVC